MPCYTPAGTSAFGGAKHICKIRRVNPRAAGYFVLLIAVSDKFALDSAGSSLSGVTRLEVAGRWRAVIRRAAQETGEIRRVRGGFRGRGEGEPKLPPSAFLLRWEQPAQVRDCLINLIEHQESLFERYHQVAVDEGHRSLLCDSPPIIVVSQFLIG